LITVDVSIPVCYLSGDRSTVVVLADRPETTNEVFTVADNHSTPSVVAPIAPALRRPSLRLAVVAAATGALVAGSVQVGAATASAAVLRPSQDGNIALQLPAGQFLPGIDIPAAADASLSVWTPASAANWIAAPKLIAPAPAPEPQAAPMPDPVPAPMADPVPAPIPDPVPAPAPVAEPVPAPTPVPVLPPPPPAVRSDENKPDLQSQATSPYAVFCL